MQSVTWTRELVLGVFVVFTGGGLARAQDEVGEAPDPEQELARPFSLSLATGYATDSEADDPVSSEPQAGETPEDAGPAKSHDYREISDFFNVREANVNTTKGEWELELESEWVTGTGGDDDFAFTPNIKYGLTEDMFIEVEVLPLNIGDGGDQGNGDLAIQVFNQFARETDTLPAFAAWAEARLPSGEGSSGVDAELHFNLTKTLVKNFRGHLEGFIETANGGRGDEDENRRPFQWGVGTGVDYQIDDLTICTVNYLHRSSEELGHPNQHILEIGGVRQIAENQHLKLAVDIGLDGQEETPDFGAKLLWSIEW